MSESPRQSLSNAVRSLSAHISTAADAEQEQPLWESARAWLEGVSRRAWTRNQVVDQIAQALVCIDAYLASQPKSVPPQGAWNWLRENANPFWKRIYQLPIVAQFLQTGRLPVALRSSSAVASHGSLSFDDFLADYDPGCRTEYGVFYTPQPLVQWIVRTADLQIQNAFAGSTGLLTLPAPADLSAEASKLVANSTPSIEILDPAAGTGVFLIEVIEQIASQLKATWLAAGCSQAEVTRQWDRYVADCLLPRLTGFELMLPAALVGQFLIVQKLAETGFRFQDPAGLQFYVMDTLAEPLQGQPTTGQAGRAASTEPELQEYLWYLEQQRLERPFTVILGNPPFSGVSLHDVPWMGKLMRGQGPLPRGNCQTPLANYYQVDGEPLGERKVWLQDDYVKFLRYCHWKIEQSGTGLVGLVTNHGYLDGPSFRGLRQSLCETFSQIKIIDLHGNLKKKECTPDGGSDENVFPISSGIAIGLFCQAPEPTETLVVEHQDLWGSADQKLATLQNDEDLFAAEIPFQSIDPAAPYYFLVPHDDQVADEYQAGFSLCDVMTERTTAAVTARDRFVVGFDKAEILERLEVFRDSQVTDDQLREQFFTNSRSAKYPPGDTRGWKLTVARAKLAADPDWRKRLQTCFYRPFDRRAIYWAPWMIDWPRTAIMKHMLELPNLGLVTRRQMLPSRPCNFFWVTDGICLDGLIRSDNRGSESIFPLYLSQQTAPAAASPQANFAPAFIAALQSHYGWDWLSFGSGDLRQSCGPLDLFHMIYAQFHSHNYRQRYQGWLRIDFPRLFLPRTAELFRLLAVEGENLIPGHLLRGKIATSGAGLSTEPNLQSSNSQTRAMDLTVAASYPKYEAESVWINSRSHFQQVARTVWEFEVGGHQVCRKWLADRRGRQLSPDEIQQYRSLVLALSDTVVRMQTIDELIDRFGGWPEAFVGNAGSVSGATERDFREIA